MYVKKGDPEKYMFFFTGGSWALSDSSEGVIKKAYSKLKDRFGTSNNHDAYYEGEAFTHYDKKINPYFYDYTVIYM